MPNPGGWPNPADYSANELKFQLDKDWGPDHDPNRPPIKEPGDGYVIAASLSGIPLGGFAGYLASLVSSGSISSLFSIVVGMFLGGVLGALTGGRLKKRALKRQTRIHI